MKRLIGDRLQLELAKRRWGQRELAEKSGVSEGAVSRHVNNVQGPTTEVVTRYAEALGLRFDDLLSLSDSEAEDARLPARIAGERAKRRLTPNAQIAVNEFDWITIAPGEENAIIELLTYVDASPDNDPPVDFWTASIQQILKIIHV